MEKVVFQDTDSLESDIDDSEDAGKIIVIFQ